MKGYVEDVLPAFRKDATERSRARDRRSLANAAEPEQSRLGDGPRRHGYRHARAGRPDIP